MAKYRVPYSECPRLIFIDKKSVGFWVDIRKGCRAPWKEQTDSVHWSATYKGACSKADAMNIRGLGNDNFHKHSTDSH